MKHIPLIVFLCASIVVENTILAQPGCPQVDAGNNITLPCTQSCVTLTANVFQAGATTSYSVTSIPYAPPFPFTGGTQIFINIDDQWSNVINLPFNFCFYGNVYNQIVIGTNGLLTFDLSLANNWCEWNFSSPIPTPGPPPGGIYNNSINGAYHDIDPSVGVPILFPPFISYPANINYAVLGTAPCRTFVVNFSTVPHYQCNNLRTTQQIVLYETTNVIEVYIQNKPTCVTWNSGNAVIGLQNADGTQGIAAPGRNTGPWTASNEAWRFTPNGPPIWTITWYDQNNNVISNFPSVTVCPSSTTTYRVEAIYVPCSGGVPVTVTDQVTVTVTGLQVDIDSSRNVSCFGGNDGYARATYSNATGLVSFGWSNGSTSLVLNNLTAGTYIFTATDAGNCTRRDTVIITQPSALLATVPDVTMSNCTGTGTSSFTATASGGTPPYSYTWNTNPPQHTSTIQNVPSGTYTVTVTDANGCTASDSGTLTVIQTNNLIIQLVNQTNVSCYGYNDGSITVAASNATAPYNYLWNTTPPQTSPSAINLSAGTYTVTVSDASGCTNSATYVITQPSVFAITIDSFRNITCHGANDGFARASLTGGIPPVIVSWNTIPPQNNLSLSNLSAGTYIVSAQDNNGCVSTDTLILTEPPLLTTTITARQSVSCYGYHDGSATVSVSGGVSPYLYVWNTTPVQNNATATNLPAGFYTVSVTDQSNCMITDTVSINQPPPIIVDVLMEQDVTCYGLDNGQAAVAATGGNAPYQYAWNSSPPQYTSTATNLRAGNYVVTITDAAGCTTTTPISISQPAPLTVSLLSKNDVSCFGLNDGEVVLNVSGGNTPYSIQWHTGADAFTLSQLSGGNYSATVTDNSGCSDTFTVAINEPFPLTASITYSDITCFGYNDGTINILAQGGTPGYTYTWSAGNYSSNSASGLPAGNYTITVADRNGCSTTVTALITEPLPIVITLSDTFIIHYGDTIRLTNSYSGGSGQISYQWTPTENLSCSDCMEPIANPLTSTRYTYSIVDETGCTASAITTVLVLVDKTIFIPNAFSPNLDGKNDIFEVIVKNVDEFDLKIFNRWGELVYHSTDPRQGWDGTYRGKPLPPAVFTYIAYCRFPDGYATRQKGSVTLIR